MALIGEYETHPAADVFPLLEGADFAALCADIAEHGLREPITRVRLGRKLVILDGRNRLRACVATSTKLQWHEFDGDDPLAFVISTNLRRRHMNESQRAMVAARLEGLERGRPRKDADLHLSRHEASSMVNVSERLVASASKVLDKGAQKLADAVDSGEFAVSAAAELVDLPYADQASVIAMIAAGTAKNARQAIRRLEEERRAAVPRPERVDCRIIESDAVEYVRLLVERPHLVVTDPPYGIETHNTRRGGQDYADGAAYALDVIERLCEQLVERLDPGAHLYFFAGYTHAWAVRELLRRFFVVQDNPLVWVKDNHTMCNFAAAYPNKHEYIWFCKQRASIRRLAKCVPDVLHFARQRDSTHTAEKPVDLLSLLIEQSSEPGELVLDPFCGSGSTGVAARALGRQFVGIESDPKWVEVARARVA
jgi:DNA modification methylase